MSTMITTDNPLRITEAQYLEYGDQYVGICRDCGAERGCTEPDAENYPCEECGEQAVFGAEQLLIMGMVEFTEVNG